MLHVVAVQLAAFNRMNDILDSFFRHVNPDKLGNLLNQLPQLCFILNG